MIERVSLFTKKEDFFLLLILSASILLFSILIHYNEYKKLTRFDSHIVDAVVLKQYTKTKNKKTYQILKLKSDKDIVFYTNAKKYLQNIIGQKVIVEVWAGEVSFYEYLTSFYAYSRIIKIDTNPTYKQKLNNYISSTHKNEDVSSIYQALYTAKILNSDLQEKFSTLGISHLIAISGFHLGLLSAVLFFIIRPLYNYFHNRYFTYRSSSLDIFIIISFILFIYTMFLDYPPSLLRAYAMLVIGFILYERGIEIISMQTLLLTVILLISLFPKLFFSIGFWLSVSGVFYIFLFLQHYKHLNKVWQFIIVPFWVYILMLPLSLHLFSNFSIYHPLSILWTSLFTIFYPLSIFLHVVGLEGVLTPALKYIISLADESMHSKLPLSILALHLIISILSVYYKKAIYILVAFSISIFIYSINYIT